MLHVALTGASGTQPVCVRITPRDNPYSIEPEAYALYDTECKKEATALADMLSTTLPCGTYDALVEELARVPLTN